MRTINLIVVHCSATQGNRMLSPEALDLMHRRRGFNAELEFIELAVENTAETQSKLNYLKNEKGGKLWQ